MLNTSHFRKFVHVPASGIQNRKWMILRLLSELNIIA